MCIQNAEGMTIEIQRWETRQEALKEGILPIKGESQIGRRKRRSNSIFYNLLVSYCTHSKYHGNAPVSPYPFNNVHSRV